MNNTLGIKTSKKVVICRIAIIILFVAFFVLMWVSHIDFNSQIDEDSDTEPKISIES